MKRTAVKLKRTAIKIDLRNQQKFSESSNLRGQTLKKLNILEYYQKQLGTKAKPNDKGYIKTLCPFHKETKPSFSANTKTGNWKCRGVCDDSGSIFKFHKRKHNFKTIDEAIKDLAVN
jgi:DNA primase